MAMFRCAGVRLRGAGESSRLAFMPDEYGFSTPARSIPPSRLGLGSLF